MVDLTGESQYEHLMDVIHTARVGYHIFVPLTTVLDFLRVVLCIIWILVSLMPVILGA